MKVAPRGRHFRYLFLLPYTPRGVCARRWIPLFRIVGVWDVAASVLLRLHASSTSFAVEDFALLMFTEAFAARGDEDAIITIAERRLEPPPGTADPVSVLQGEPVYVEACRVHR